VVEGGVTEKVSMVMIKAFLTEQNIPFIDVGDVL